MCSTYGAFVSHLDLSRAPYGLYGVKYIDLVSLGAFAPGSRGEAGGRCVRRTAPLFPHTPKGVTYHEQSHYCRFMIRHSLGRMDISYFLTTFPFI